jgi:DNA-binding transcriptional MerR regulator
MASTYRLSALSLSHGLETGLTIADIRKLLEEMSDKALPQPIEYLLNEAQQRFARLQIVEAEEGERVYLRSTDKVLLAEILNESKLKPFGLVQLEDDSLATRFEAEVIYFGLRELGFVAVRVDKDGKVISPLAASVKKHEQEQINSVAADIARIREQEEKIGTAPDDDDLQRQIQLAIKNKAKATFTVTSSSGAEIEFLLEPIGIANGRLRAKDRKADIERTLPIASIIRVTLD